MSTNYEGELSDIRAAAFWKRPFVNWVRDKLTPRLVLFDNNWYRTPGGLKLRLPPPEVLLPPFFVTTFRDRNSRNTKVTVAPGYVVYPLYNFSAQLGQFEGVAQVVPTLNDRSLTAEPPPELSLPATFFDGEHSLFVSMAYQLFVTATTDGIRDSNSGTHGQSEQAIQYSGAPIIEVKRADEVDSENTGRIFWKIASLDAPGEVTQAIRSDIFAPNWIFSKTWNKGSLERPGAVTPGDITEGSSDTEAELDPNRPPLDPGPFPLPTGPPPPI